MVIVAIGQYGAQGISPHQTMAAVMKTLLTRWSMITSHDPS